MFAAISMFGFIVTYSILFNALDQRKAFSCILRLKRVRQRHDSLSIESMVVQEFSGRRMSER